ncbi:MAG TPA: hypothetical protein VIL74_01135 [Pyrinomonadaceae bacterium]|jgi:hypothetical protein
MKIAVINTGSNDALPPEARLFLPKLLAGLAELGNEIHLFERGAPAAGNDPPFSLHRLTTGDAAAAQQINGLNADVCLIWDAEETGWNLLPRLAPATATLAVGHADSEIYYAPVRHYRPFLTRVIGTTPETCVGFVISCVLDKERVEWISYDEGETDEVKNKSELIATYLACFEKAAADAHAAPRESLPDFPPLRTTRPSSQSWLGKLKARILN